MVVKIYTIILLLSLTSFNAADNECGRSKVKASMKLADVVNRITYNAPLSHAGQFPWLATLFHNKKGYLCGSSIISQWHLLTAAHCVISDVTDYYALVGQFNLTNSNEINSVRKNMSEVFVHTDFDKDNINTQRSNGDIAIFRTANKILYNDFVQPVCLPLATANTINVNGVVAGYGKAEILGDHQNVPSYVELTSISIWECLKKGLVYGNIISERSFCAGNDYAVPCQGDSGGGFYHFNKATSQYTIHGIVSFAVGLCDPNDYVAFVDVSKYIPWIQEKIDSFKDPCKNVHCGQRSFCDIIDNQPQCVCLTQFPGVYPDCGRECSRNEDCANDRACKNHICTNLCLGSAECVANAKCSMVNHRIECKCVAGYKGNGKNKCEIDTSQTTPVVIDIPKQPTNLVALKNYRNFNLINSQSCGTTSMESFGRVKRIVNGYDAKLLEFPWAVLLAYTYPLDEKINWKCGGNLISKRFVLTGATCLNNELSFVRLGEHKITTTIDCEDQNKCADPVQDIMIEKKIKHPKYDRVKKINDIALLKLTTPADTMKNNVKTICLPISPENDLETIQNSLSSFTIFGWGVMNLETRETADVLQKAYIPYVDQLQCGQKYGDSLPQRIKINPTYLCAGGQNGIDACQGDSGGGITVLAKQNGLQKETLYGVNSFGAACGSDFPGIYTNIRYYLDWILDNIS